MPQTDVPEFPDVQPGLLEEGTETTYGIITAVSLTAYQVNDGPWLAFAKFHGKPPMAEPLVVFG